MQTLETRQPHRSRPDSGPASRDGDEQHGGGAVVVERTKWEAVEPQDVTASEAVPAPVQALQLDLTARDDDQGVGPAILLEPHAPAGRKPQLAAFERGREPSAEEGEVAFVAIVTHTLDPTGGPMGTHRCVVPAGHVSKGCYGR
jgi:hypothetical protein